MNADFLWQVFFVRISGTMERIVITKTLLTSILKISSAETSRRSAIFTVNSLA